MCLLGGVRSRLLGSAHLRGDAKGLGSPRGASLRQDSVQPGAERQRDRQVGPADAAAAARTGSDAPTRTYPTQTPAALGQQRWH